MSSRTLARLASRHRSEDGVTALLTLVVLLVLVLPVCFVSWQVAYIVAAQSRLVAAVQAAAYASAAETQFGAQANASNQLRFDCGTGFAEASQQTTNPHCVEGRTAQAARSLLQAALQGDFGLTYQPDESGSVKLIDEQGQPLAGVLAYEVSLPSGAAEAIASPTCTDPFQPDPESGQNTRVCWRNPTDQLAQTNTVSGVVVIAEAHVELPQGCSGPFCLNYTIRVSETGRQAQQPQQSNYR